MIPFSLPRQWLRLLLSIKSSFEIEFTRKINQCARSRFWLLRSISSRTSSCCRSRAASPARASAPASRHSPYSARVNARSCMRYTAPSTRCCSKRSRSMAAAEDAKSAGGGSSRSGAAWKPLAAAAVSTSVVTFLWKGSAAVGLVGRPGCPAPPMGPKEALESREWRGEGRAAGAAGGSEPEFCDDL